MQKIYFENSEGNKLCGVLSDPTKDKSQPVVLFCHGLFSSKDARTYLGLERIFNDHQLSTLRFDFFGHGESEGNSENVTISQAVDDALSAISFLKKQNYSKIGLVASSCGGITALMVASKLTDLYVLALKSPVSNFKERDFIIKGKKKIDEWKRNGFTYHARSDGSMMKLSYTFFKDYDNNDGYEAARKIKIPTLIVHGDKDDIVPVSQSQKTAGLIENCELKVIKGADHLYSKPEDFEEMLNSIADFIIKKSKRKT